jgi:ABC-type Na+ efflux pump permease subunit
MRPAVPEAYPVALPRAIAWLGYGGLIPFVLLALASLLGHQHSAVWIEALVAYGAIILSFVGALHWGLAMCLPGLTDQQRSARFAWSVVPALVAWPALLMPAPLAAPPLVFGFIAHYLQDRRLARQATLPAWYLPLRLRLSSVAGICLIAGVYCSGV